MIQLNLLPDIKREFIKAQKIRNKVISLSILLMIGVIGALVVLFLFANGAQRFQMSYLDGQIDQKAKELADQKDLDKYLTIQSQLAALPGLHSAKGQNSRMFEYLVRLNPAAPDNVRISKLSLDTTGKVLALEGFADNYKSLNVFKKTLENADLVYREGDQESKEKLFVDVQFSQVGVGDQQSGTTTKKVASFTATLTYTDKAFAADVQSPTVQVPAMNITNSVTGTPSVTDTQQIFENKPEGN